MTATLSCSNCDGDVPEGAYSCPLCGASVGTVMFGRRRSLSRTLIGKALELRDSIPWASASAVVLLTDDKGHRRPRPLGILAVAAGLALFCTGVWALVRPRAHKLERPQPTAQGAAHDREAAPDPTSAPVVPAPEPEPTAAQAPAAHAAASHATHSAHATQPSHPAKGGTLTVSAYYRGKPTSARVFVDGKERGMTPLSLSLSPSKYTLRVEKRGFHTERRAGVQVHAGKKLALRVDLKK